MKTALESVRRVCLRTAIAERNNRFWARGADFKQALVAIHWGIASRTGAVTQTVPSPCWLPYAPCGQVHKGLQ